MKNITQLYLFKSILLSVLLLTTLISSAQDCPDKDESSATIAVTNETCFGSNDGTLQIDFVNASGVYNPGLGDFTPETGDYEYNLFYVGNGWVYTESNFSAVVPEGINVSFTPPNRITFNNLPPTSGGRGYIVYIVGGNCNSPAQDYGVGAFGHEVVPAADIVIDGASIVTTGNEKCASPYSGSIDASGAVSGGAGGYEYSIDGGVSYQASPIFNDLIHDIYTLTVRDSNSCKKEESGIVIDDNRVSPTTSISPSPASTCVSEDLILDGNPGDGAGGFLHNWTGDTGFLSSTNVRNPTFNSGTAGIYNLTYTVTDANGCTASSSISVTVNEVEDSSFDYAQSSYCQDEVNPVAQNVVTSGGVFSSTTGLVFVDSSTGEIDLTNSTPGVYTITHTTTGGCPSSSTFEVTIVEVEDSSFDYAQPSYCQDEVNPVAQNVVTSGGVFSSTTGLVFVDSSTGEIDLTNSTPGVYTITHTTTGGCPSSSTFEVTIVEVEDSSFDYAQPSYCQDEVNPVAQNVVTSGGVFSSTAGLVFVDSSTGEIDLTNSTPGVYTITHTTTGGCPSSSTFEVTIVEVEDSSFDYAQSSYCQDEVNPVAQNVVTSGGVFSSTAGLVFVDSSTGEIDLTNSTPGVYTITHTTTGGCPSSSTFEVTIVEVEDSSFDYAQSSYCQDEVNPVAQNVVTSGGVFSSTAGLVFVDSSTGEIDLSASTAGVYTITHTTTGGCPSSSTFEVTIVEVEDSSFDYAQSSYCQDEVNPVAQNVVTSGGVFSSTAGLVFVDSSTGEIDLTNSTPGVYTITHTTTGGCPSSSTFEVTIVEVEDSSFDYAQSSYCQDEVNPVAQNVVTSGGVFSSTAGLVFVDSSTGEIDLTNSTPGVYTITHTTTGGCPSSSTFEVTIVEMDDASFSYSGSPYCQYSSNVSPTISGDAGEFSSTAGLEFVDSGSNSGSSSGEIDLTNSAPGVYTITYTTTGACASVATQTITIDGANDPSFSYATSTLCQDGGPELPDFIASPGGTFSAPSGLSIDGGSGEIDPSTSSEGTYLVSYGFGGSCPTSSTFEVTITNAPDASFTYAESSYCQDATDPSPSFGAGASAGVFSSTAGLVFVDSSTGEIDLSASTAGVYTVTNTIGASGSCSASVATYEVTIVEVEDSSFDYAQSSYCQDEVNPVAQNVVTSGGVFSSTAGLVFVDSSTGEIDLTNSTPGVYTITHTTTGGCPSSSTFEVTIVEVEDSSFDYAQSSYCQDEVNPVAQNVVTSGGVFSSTAGLVFVDSSTGEIDLTNSTPGVYTITHTTTGGCPSSSTFEVTIVEMDDASFSYSGSPYCQYSSNVSPTISGDAGEFSSTAGLEFVDSGSNSGSSSGEIDLTNSAPGVYTITYTTTGACASVATQTITIDGANDPSFSYATSTLCQDGGPELPDFIASPGGTFSAPSGLSIDGGSGEIDPSTSSEGTYLVSYGFGGSCPTSSTFEVTITNAPDASFTYAESSYCQDATDPSPSFGAGASAGVFSSTAGLVFVDSSTGEIDLSASTAGVYTVTNTIGASGSCSASVATYEVTIVEVEDSSFDYAQSSYCQDEVNPVAQNVVTSGGVFSSTAGLVFVDSSTGEIDLTNSTPGVYTITHTTTGGCPSSSTFEVTIVEVEDSSFDYAQSSYCQDEVNPVAQNVVTSGGVFSSTAGLVFVDSSTGEIDLSASTAGVYTITHTTTGGCPSSSTFEVTIVEVEDSSFDYAQSSYCQDEVNPVAQNVVTSGGVFSSTAGLVFVDSSTGEIDLTNSTPGVYTITHTTTGGCPSSSTFEVTIVEVEDSSFDYAQSSYCQDEVNPVAQNVVTSGGVFSSTAGLVFVDSSTGEIDLTNSTPGVYTITHTTTGGCPSSSTFEVTIVEMDDASFSYSGSPYCQYSSNVSPTISGDAGEFSSTAGLEFVDSGSNSGSSSGEIDLTNSAPGVYTITYTTTGACASVATQTITIDGANDPSFSYATSTLCQDGGPELPDFIASPGGTFSAPSGLSIDGGSGEIDPSTSSEGTYLVSYGFGGSCPTSSTFEVTITNAPDASFTYAESSYCQDATDPSPSFGAGASAGVFSSTAGLVFVDSSTGEIDLSASTAGVYTVTNTIGASGSCSASVATYEVTIVEVEDSSFDYAQSSYCQDEVNPVAQNVVTSGGVFSSTAGLVFVDSGSNSGSNSGEIDLSGSTAGVYTITHTTTGGCPSSSTFEVTLVEVEDSSFDYAQSSYCQDEVNPVAQNVVTSGGVFSSTAGLVFVDSSTGEIDLSGSTAGVYTITHTTTGGCPSSSTFEVTIVEMDDASFSYSGSPYCQYSSNVSPTISGDAGEFSSTAGLEFVDSGSNSGSSSGEIDLTNSAPGVYTITYTTTGACASVATQTITIDGANDPSFSYATSTLCQDGGPELPDFIASPGGTFSAPSGLSIDGGSGEIDPSTSSEGTYLVSYGFGGSCPTSSTFEVTITNAPDASFTYAESSYCQDATDPSPSFGAGASAGVFSSTAGLVFVDSSTGEIDLSASTAGVYTVTNTIGASGSCSASVATYEVTIVEVEDSSFDYAQSSYCQDEVNPVAQNVVTSGGVFSSTAGLVFVDSSTGEIDLTNSTPGVYTITHTTTGGCPSSSTFEVTIVETPDAGFSYTSGTYCQAAGRQSPIVNQAGGNFGSIGALPIGFLDPATGEIDPSVGNDGDTYTITYEIIGASCTDIQSFNVTITNTPDATFDYDGVIDGEASFCQSDADPSPTGNPGKFSAAPSGLVYDENTGVIDLSESAPGTYTMTNTITESGGCPAVSYDVLVNVRGTQDASFSFPNSVYCKNETENPLASISGASGTFDPVAGIVWEDDRRGEINLEASTPGTYTITYRTSGTCPSSSTFELEIRDVEDASFNYGGITEFCQGDADPAVSIAVPGGTFSAAPALAINASTGEIDLSASNPDNYEIIYVSPGTSPNLCADTSRLSITINEEITADAGTDAASCELTYQLVAAEPTSGTGVWTLENTPSGTEIVSFSAPTNDTTLVTVSDFGMYEFRWEVTNGSCVSSDVVEIEFYEPLSEISFLGRADATCDPLAPGGRWVISTAPLPNPMTGGSGDYSFAWVNSNGDAFDNDPSLNNISNPSDNGTNPGVPGGVYIATVIDNITGCERSQAIHVENADISANVFITGTNSSCNANETGNGQIDVSFAGTGPYRVAYHFEDGSLVQPEQTFPIGSLATSITGLSGGTYYVDIQDNGTGCSHGESVSLTEPAPLSIENVIANAATCNGGNDGSISLDVVGGTGPYTYNWTGPTTIPSTTEDPTNILVAGDYVLELVDNTGCTFVSDTITIGEPAPENAPMVNGAINIGCNSFDISWSNEGVANYNVQVATDTLFNAASLIADYNPYAITDGSTSLTVNTNLSASTKYFYRVSADKSCGFTVYSAPDSVITESVPAPQAIEVNGLCDKFTAEWSAVSGATEYFLDVTTDPTFAVIDTRSNVSITAATTYEVDNLTEVEPYYYRVRARTTCGISDDADSNVVEVNLSGLPEQPVIQAITNPDCDGFEVEWATVSTASSYRVEASVNNTFSSIDTFNDVPGTKSSASLSDLNPGSSYFVRVIAKNACGENISDIIEASTADLPASVGAISLTEDGAACNSLEVTWDEPDEAKRYEITIDDNSDFSSPIEVQTVTSNTYLFSTGLLEGREYHIRVVPTNDCGIAAATVASFTTLEKPAQPSGLDASVNCTSAILNWDAIGNADAYFVEVFDENALLVDSATVTSENTEVTGLDINSEYTFQVTARNACGDSDVSVATAFTTADVPLAPTNVEASNASCDGFTVSWDEDVDAIGYIVEAATDASFSTIVETLTVTTNTATFITLDTETSYEYRVTTENACGIGASTQGDAPFTTLPEDDCGCGFEKAEFVISSENTNCPASADGALMVYINPTATTTPERFEYRYVATHDSIDWSAGGSFPGLVFLADSLAAGDYTIFVRDKNAQGGCEEIKSYVRTISVQNTASVTTSPETCAGSDGRITVNVPASCNNGGLLEIVGNNVESGAPIFFTGGVAEELVAGSYEIIIRDDEGNGLDTLYTSVITTCSNNGGGGSDLICELGDKTVDVAVTASNCETGEGAVSFSVIGGEDQTYRFRVVAASGAVNETQTAVGSATFNELPAGEYEYIVTDEAGSPRCQSSFSVVENIVVINTISYTLPTCDAAEQTATLEVQLSAATNAPAPYDVFAIIGSDTVSTAVIEAGTTSTEVEGVPTGSDVNVVVASRAEQSCPSGRIVNIPETGIVAISFDHNSEDISCFGEGGSVTVNNIVVAEDTEFTINIMSVDQAQPYATRIFSAIPSSYTFANLAKGDYQIQIVQQQTNCGIISTESSPTFTIDGGDEELSATVAETVFVNVNEPYGTIKVDSIQGGGQPYEVRIAADPNGATTDWVEVVNDNPVIQPYSYEYHDMERGTYFVEVRDRFGCSLLYEVEVRYTAELYIPNIITPNGDGDNDTFKIINLTPEDSEQGAKMLITNRWGKIVYESDNYSNDKGWDGEGNADGMYFYQLIMPDGNKFTGWIEVWRGRTP
ncbi:fibronectin type III domain-containing protein [Porifericola rhodea]|uniref:fibronectin type III domain-containing protein n=1 Tax=Porifericola rhodea TaxID=930972 RepID=UPI002665F038|nr:fibronectin type III domain-containing protein [Porifericola rhodea]WKN32257.1 fibronectin type III domain-containing protein [Porifericola rhodea]